MKKHKVCIAGGDGIGWAVDEDLKLARESLERIVELVDLKESEIVHAVWWYGLLGHPESDLVGKRVICHVPGEPFRYFTLPQHQQSVNIVGRWITRTSQARDQMKEIGIQSDLVPYLVDTEVFKPLKADDPSLRSFREKWGIPEDVYLIGSFQRDTEGADLRSPKLVKGPDIFLETLLGLVKRNLRFHVALAGPRRHWMLKKLEENGIPFTYLGKRSEGEDLYDNALPRTDLNLLYNLIDLYIVASRSEGGPHAILEAAASGCKIISTPVGMAPEVLEQKCIFNMPSEAAGIIAKDFADGYLADTIKVHYDRVMERHVPGAVIPNLGKIYSNIEAIPVFEGSPDRRKGNVQAMSSQATKDSLKVCLWHSFFKPPYGGGNQVMMALRKGLLKKGVEVVENTLDESIDAYVLNSIHFDVDSFLEFSRNHRINVLHRIDGPISLIRGYDLEKDQLCYDLNARFASATVLQSAWVYKKIITLGYNPVSPTIIHNAVDAEIFNSHGRTEFDRNRKIRLISSSWSDNQRKGGPIYKWIERNLDWDRFDYTFVGNASENFDRIRRIEAVPSEELADLLRSHDIFITASQNDPCSNAVIEALACGLPVLYLNDGGHPELVSYGGLPFDNQEQIPALLDRLVEDYESFQRLITVNKMEDVAEKYLYIIREIIK
jgi:glycosyltransferase involved in cell wall biosynthesis